MCRKKKWKIPEMVTRERSNELISGLGASSPVSIIIKMCFTLSIIIIYELSEKKFWKKKYKSPFGLIEHVWRKLWLLCWTLWSLHWNSLKWNEKLRSLRDSHKTSSIIFSNINLVSSFTCSLTLRAQKHYTNIYNFSELSKRALETSIESEIYFFFFVYNKQMKTPLLVFSSIWITICCCLKEKVLVQTISTSERREKQIDGLNCCNWHSVAQCIH